jgi:hypothetical protein
MNSRLRAHHRPILWDNLPLESIKVRRRAIEPRVRVRKKSQKLNHSPQATADISPPGLGI